jgi:hypothetical protein
MAEIESDIFFETLRKKKEPEKEARRLKSLAILFINGNPTPLFVRYADAEEQAVIELAFSEANVENPDVKREKLRGYCC